MSRLWIDPDAKPVRNDGPYKYCDPWKPKPKAVEVTEGQPQQWVDVVYGMYGSPNADDVTTVWASEQIGSCLTINPLLRDLRVGTVLNIEGVNSFSRRLGKTTTLRDFVVTAPAKVGERVLHVYPPLLHFNTCDGTPRTTVAAPKNGARVFLSRLSKVVDYIAPESDPA